MTILFMEIILLILKGSCMSRYRCQNESKRMIIPGIYAYDASFLLQELPIPITWPLWRSKISCSSWKILAAVIRTTLFGRIIWETTLWFASSAAHMVLKPPADGGTTMWMAGPICSRLYSTRTESRMRIRPIALSIHSLMEFLDTWDIGRSPQIRFRMRISLSRAFRTLLPNGKRAKLVAPTESLLVWLAIRILERIDSNLWAVLANTCLYLLLATIQRLASTPLHKREVIANLDGIGPSVLTLTSIQILCPRVALDALRIFWHRTPCLPLAAERASGNTRSCRRILALLLTLRPKVAMAKTNSWESSLIAAVSTGGAEDLVITRSGKWWSSKLDVMLAISPYLRRKLHLRQRECYHDPCCLSCQNSLCLHLKVGGPFITMHFAFGYHNNPTAFWACFCSFQRLEDVSLSLPQKEDNSTSNNNNKRYTILLLLEAQLLLSWNSCSYVMQAAQCNSMHEDA